MSDTRYRISCAFESQRCKIRTSTRKNTEEFRIFPKILRDTSVTTIVSYGETGVILFGNGFYYYYFFFCFPYVISVLKLFSGVYLVNDEVADSVLLPLSFRLERLAAIANQYLIRSFNEIRFSVVTRLLESTNLRLYYICSGTNEKYPGTIKVSRSPIEIKNVYSSNRKRN